MLYNERQHDEAFSGSNRLIFDGRIVGAISGRTFKRNSRNRFIDQIGEQKTNLFSELRGVGMGWKNLPAEIKLSNFSKDISKSR